MNATGRKVSVLGALVLAGCSSSSGGSPSGTNDHGSSGSEAVDSGVDTGVRSRDAGKDQGTNPYVDAGHPVDATAPIDVTAVDVKTSVDSGGTKDARTVDTGKAKDAGGGGGMDVGAPSGPEEVLVTFGGVESGQSELVAVNVTKKAVDGRFDYIGSGATDTHSAVTPFVLEEVTDVVGRLDETKPWIVDSSWPVRLSDGIDGGPMNADPVGVVVASNTLAYVLRFQRNDILVIDQASDGGTPMTTIDLSSYLTSSAAGSLVGMTAGVYVPTTKRAYIVLSNVDQATDSTDSAVICGSFTSTLIAIDTTSNSPVSLGGSGPHGAVELSYVNPLSMTYDSANDRLVIVEAGCYAAPASPGGAVGALSHGGIEAVNLTTNAVTSMMALTAAQWPAGFVYQPTSFAYINETTAIIGFYYTGAAVYQWNPMTGAIGNNILNAPDMFTYDGVGNLVGTREITTDAGVHSTQVVSMNATTGDTTVLGTNVTELTGTTYVAAVDVWPHP